MKGSERGEGSKGGKKAAWAHDMVAAQIKH